MERTERDIVEFMKRYKDKPENIEAMADMLAFMGISDAPIFLDAALKEIQEEKTDNFEMRQLYYSYLRRGSKFYMSYEKFLQKKEAGEI